MAESSEANCVACFLPPTELSYFIRPDFEEMIKALLESKLIIKKANFVRGKTWVRTLKFARIGLIHICSNKA